MANRNNSGRSKKSHNYRPYDTSNSFVKRLTAKVSEILPQPTSWVSRLFSTSPKLNVRERDELEEEEEDEEERQPPSKRLCFNKSEVNDYTHQNNINRLGIVEKESGNLSPIAPLRDDDLAVAGPSGLQLRHFPVASTPAIRPPPSLSPAIKVREKVEPERTIHQQQQPQRDDASDGSETTSGCSSLVPGIRPEQPIPPKPSPNLQSALTSPTMSSIRRLSTSAMQSPSTSLHRTNLNLSASSHPTFDSYVFNNPLNRSGIRKRLLGEESSFYYGNTTFGGSSSRTSSPVSEPRKVTVKPSPARSQPLEDTIGASALRILKALEQFSSPVMDARRMPMRSASRSVDLVKRKPPQPYEELIIPSMPDLLRVKRQEREQRAVAETSGNASNSSPTSAAPGPSTSQSQYSLRVDNPKEKHRGVIKGRNKDMDMESVPDINLPTHLKFDLPSLPKIDFSAVSAKNNPVPTPKPKALPPTSSESPPFKFSSPPSPAVSFSKSESVSSPVNTFKFSEPLDPLKYNDSESTKSSSQAEKPSTSQLQMQNPSPNNSLKRKPGLTAEKNLGFTPKSPLDENKSSISLIEGKSRNKSPTINSSISCSEAEKCSKSKKSLSSDASSSSIQVLDSTVDCGNKKGEKPSNYDFKKFEGFSRPKDSWECKTCLVNNKNTAETCAACATPKDGKTGNKNMNTGSSNKFSHITSDTTGKPVSLSNSLKTPAGSWECSTCLVRNKKDDLKCAACSSNKPGVTPTEQPKPTFTFGLPTSSNSHSTNFLPPKPDTKPQPQQFTFGTPLEKGGISSKSPASSSGDNKKSNEMVSFSSTSVVSSTVSSSAPLVNSFKKSEGSWECDTCLVQNKKETTSCVACGTNKPGCSAAEKSKAPEFTFGIPSTPSSTSSAQVNSNVNDTACSSTTSAPIFTFGKPSETNDEPKITPSFNFTNAINTSSSKNETKSVNFLNSNEPKEKEVKPASEVMFAFGNNGPKGAKTEVMNDEENDKPAKKRVTFGNPLTSEASLPNDRNSVTFGIVPSTKSNEVIPTSNFAFNPFENTSKPTTTSLNPFFTFGSNSDTSKQNTSTSAKPTLPFGSGSSESPAPSNTSNTFGGFKMSETGSKPFTFVANSQNSAQSGGFSFNSGGQSTGFAQDTLQQQAKPSMLFGQQQSSATATPSLFNQPQEQKPFVFNSPGPTTQQQPVFSLNAATPSQTAPPGIGAGAPSGGFNFSASVAPKFDPNIKPSFNFTGGTTPSFNAAPSSVVSERKMKRGIRRVTANR